MYQETGSQKAYAWVSSEQNVSKGLSEVGGEEYVLEGGMN